VLTGKGEEFTPEEICAWRDRERERERERERDRERETRKINTCKAKG